MKKNLVTLLFGLLFITLNISISAVFAETVYTQRGKQMIFAIVNRTNAILPLRWTFNSVRPEEKPPLSIKPQSFIYVYFDKVSGVGDSVGDSFVDVDVNNGQYRLGLKPSITEEEACGEINTQGDVKMARCKLDDLVVDGRLVLEAYFIPTTK